MHRAWTVLKYFLYQPHRSEEWNILKSFIVKHTQGQAKNQNEKQIYSTVQKKKKKKTNTRKDNRLEHL